MATKPAFAPAAQIEHSKYGLGSVLACNEEHIVIKFDDHGEKKFVLSIAMAALKKSDRQPSAVFPAPVVRESSASHPSAVVKFG